VLFSAGIRSIGPLLIERGNVHQRAYLPAILRGDEIWCQGFSEPEAGSDLGAIRSTAHKIGDAYVLNGQKLWTSGAHLARRVFALFRTDPQSQGGAGLSFFLVDMHAPGVRVCPLLDLNGEHEFNQVFFDDVIAPVDDLVGEQDQGWEIAKRLMALARANNSPSAHVRRLLKRIDDAIDDATSQAYLLQFAALKIELEAFCVLEQRRTATLSSAAKASMLKLQGSELKQKACALALDIGCVTPGDDDTSSMALLQKQYLSSRAASIYSGTSEIHRNLIARALLR
jgi:acyl-CoA dehydrogenase